jgi:hypothetical protein
MHKKEIAPEFEFMQSSQGDLIFLALIYDPL